MKPKTRRWIYFLSGSGLFTAAVVLGLLALQQNVTYFYAPKDVVTQNPSGKIRVGGLVKPGSVQRLPDVITQFTLYDDGGEVPTVYQGILPDLFREGQGIIAEGDYHNGTLKAETVLAKHDENYRPPTLEEDYRYAE